MRVRSCPDELGPRSGGTPSRRLSNDDTSHMAGKAAQKRSCWCVSSGGNPPDQLF